MRNLKRKLAAVITAALCMSAIPVTSIQAESVDYTVKPNLEKVSPFHDTNGDGMGEFEGWGTSLCWWANRLGYDETLTEEAARVFFSEEGLNMNIGRYNIGGGDLVGDRPLIPVNDKAVFYDLETEGYMPTYSGSSMSVGINNNMADLKYRLSDADFGITQGDLIGGFPMIGWINGLNEGVSSGGNLRYQVETKEAGQYTVKLLMTLGGEELDRNVAIEVNDQKQYVFTVEDLLKNIMADGNNNRIFRITFSDVTLKEGSNTIDIGGIMVNDADNSWTLDFIKMAVIKSGEEGVLPEQEDFLHRAHITRSDSAVPGYATDVTKIEITEETPLSWYEGQFARVDESCGYAWNYDWDADKDQMAILKAAAQASGEEFLAEAFSNSPPYFMTYSGCSSGAVDAGEDNLREDSYEAFAAYMADVIEHWHKEGVITFQSVSPMNEPYTEYWRSGSVKQEGCHFDQGESQSKILLALNAELEKKGIDIILAATDETSVDIQIDSYLALSDEAKKVVDRIDTHTYKGSKRQELSELAKSEDKNLWMSEVDGGFTAGVNAGEMSGPLAFAQRIITDVNGLECSAWILWNAVDMHIDSQNEADFEDWDEFNSKNDLSQGYWGIAVADHDEKEIFLTKKYYAYGQFSRYIRPGATILGSTYYTLTAYDEEQDQMIIVAVNSSGNEKNWAFDLSDFILEDAAVTAIRTSGSLENGENWADVSDDAAIIMKESEGIFTAKMKENSITTFIVDGVHLFEEGPVYEDVAETDWFYDAVSYTYKKGLMTGMDQTHFGPYGQLSRAQFALMLYRMEGEETVETVKSFGDIAGDEWYGQAVLWAAENGIVTGYQNGNFGPADLITREQMAVMMYRYAKYLGQDVKAYADLEKFVDGASVSEFATDAMKWANGAGIITGKDNGTKLDPQGNTARSEAAVIIQRFMNK